MESVLVVSLDTNDLRAAILKKAKELLGGNGNGVSVGLNVREDKVVAGLVLDDQHLRDAAIEYAQNSLEKRVIGPVNVEFDINTNHTAGIQTVEGAKVNFKWGGKGQ